MSQPEPPSTPSVSRTCIYTAAGRAIGAREPDPAARNPDTLAAALLGDPATLDVDHPAVRALGLPYDEAMTQVEVVTAVRMMTIRTRFIDDALARAVARGARQVVILGAGFDSHAYRCGDLLAAARVFEVDRAATQRLKRQRVEAVLGSPPTNLTYVALDFQHEDLAEVLSRHGYDRSRLTFFILEGVTMYVPEAGVRHTLTFVGSHPPGSGVVFDYVYRPMIDMLATLNMATVPEAQKAAVARFLDLIRDEPWVFGLPPGGEQQFLDDFHLRIADALTIGGEESVTRYLTRADGTRPGDAAIAAAMARMAERAAAAAQEAPRPQMSPERMREQQRLMAYQLAEAIVVGTA